MRMKLLAIAALSALPAAAFAQQYIVVPQGTVVQAQPIDPNAPVYYTNSQAPVMSSSGPVMSGSSAPNVVSQPAPASEPIVGNPMVGTYTTAPAVVAGTPVVVSPGAPVTQKPAESGPGAIDRTHPGVEPGNAPSVRDAGTSSAGSGN